MLSDMGMMINRRRACGGKKLPYDAEIEYLESSGTQYILTEINPKIGDIYRIDTICQYSQYVVSNTWLTGWYMEENNSSLFGTYQSRIYFTYNVDNNITAANQGLTLKHHIRYNYDGISIDGQYLASFVNNTPLTIVPNMPNGLPIFCRYNNGAYRDGIRAKVYRFIIQLNGKIVFNGIPVRIGQVGYMYDKVSGQLFGNAGTGNFILGPDKVKLPSGYKQLEYIENTSNAYIDTGIKPDANTDIEACFIIEPHAGYGSAFGVSDGQWSNNAFTVSTFHYGSYGYGNSGESGHDTFDYRLYDSIIFRLNSYGFYVNDVMKGNNSRFQKTVQMYNLTFFVAHYGDQLVELGRFKCKWAKIKDNNTLVRNFIPCKNPNNVVGMYDTVNSVFYSSPNGKAFIAGPEV